MIPHTLIIHYDSQKNPRASLVLVTSTPGAGEYQRPYPMVVFSVRKSLAQFFMFCKKRDHFQAFSFNMNEHLNRTLLSRINSYGRTQSLCMYAAYIRTFSDS